MSIDDLVSFTLRSERKKLEDSLACKSELVMRAGEELNKCDEAHRDSLEVRVKRTYENIIDNLSAFFGEAIINIQAEAHSETTAEVVVTPLDELVEGELIFKIDLNEEELEEMSTYIALKKAEAC